MNDESRRDEVAASVNEVFRHHGTTSDIVFARPSQVRERYEAHRALRRTIWEALAAHGVVSPALGESSDARAFRTRCPCCQGRGTVASYSEHYKAYLVSRGRQLRDPCPACRRDRRHYSPGWVENPFPMSAEAMVSVALLGPRLLEVEASARELGRLVTGREPPAVAWRIDTLGRWPKDARRALLRVMRRGGWPHTPSLRALPSRKLARSVDAAQCAVWARPDGGQTAPCPLVTVARMRALGADLIDVDERVATVFVATDDLTRTSIGWRD